MTIPSIIIAILFSVLIGTIIAHQTTPKKIHFATENIATNTNNYWYSVYNCDNCQNLICSDKINWFWDTVPAELHRPINENLSFNWPPKIGSAFRMTAFPYPKTGKSKFWLFQFIKGMSSLLDNTSDQVTFPAWQISIYDPLEPNYNSWQNMLETSQGGIFKWNNLKLSPIDNLVKNQLKFSPLKQRGLWLEVTHSCYAPPNCAYPVCDDGGYWLYGCSGSGVFWNCITRKNLPFLEGRVPYDIPGPSSSPSPSPSPCPKPEDDIIIYKGTIIGGCLVCNNKIDAMFKLWNYIIDLSNQIDICPGLQNRYKQILLNSQKVAGISGDTIMKAEDYLEARLKGSGGGNSLTKAMREIIDAFHRGKQIPKLTAWRSMEPQQAYGGWYTFCIFNIILIVLYGLAVVRFIQISLKSFHGKKPWWQVILYLVALIIIGVIFLLVEWSVLAELMLTHFGYTTLDMALKKSKLNLQEFIFASAGLDKTYTKLPPKHYNSIANGLAQIQNFDFDLSSLASASELDSVIMHTQPNKSGSWAVEILDVRNTPVPPKASSLGDLIYKLGLCGSPTKTENSSGDSCQVNDNAYDYMPSLAKGPITETKNIYFGYQPEINHLTNLPKEGNKCNCNDSAVAAQFKTDGKLKKCVYCENTISQQLC